MYCKNFVYSIFMYFFCMYCTYNMYCMFLFLVLALYLIKYKFSTIKAILRN